MSSTTPASPSTRDRVISVVAVVLSLCFLGLGLASYVYPALSPFFIVFSTVGALFLGFLQVFPRFTLNIPGLHFRLVAKWLLIPICVLSLLLNAFLVVSLFSRGTVVTAPHKNSQQPANVPAHRSTLTPVVISTTPPSVCNATNKGSTGKGNIAVACQSGPGNTINIKQGS
jgi:hypothetical protein